MKNFLHKTIHWLVFSIYMVLHFVTSVFTTYYGDDYYYAGFVRKGWDYFVSENIFHYTNTNGRAFVHFLDELLIGWSFWAWRVFNLLCTAALIILIAAIASKRYVRNEDKSNKKFRCSLILSCAMFGILDIAILRESVYWATGAMNYFFPIVLTLAFFYFYRKAFEHSEGHWWLIPLAFAASFTTEQASIASLAIAAALLFSSIIFKHKKVRFTYILALLASAAGNILVFAAPGNKVRTGYYEEFYKLNLFGKIRYNFSIMFNEEIALIGTIMAIFFVLMAYKFFKRSKEFDGFISICNIFAGCACFFSCGIVLYARFTSEKIGYVGYAFLGLTVIFLVISQIYNYFKHHRIAELYFPVCAFVLQAAMLISPLHGPRTTMISALMLSVVVVEYLCEMVENKSYSALAFSILIVFVTHRTPSLVFSKYLIAVIIAFVLSVLVLKLAENCETKNVMAAMLLSVCLIQFASVPLGYMKNVEVNEKSRQSVEKYMSGQSGDKVTIYYIPDANYAYTMPYESKYHENVLKLLIGMDGNGIVEYSDYVKDADQ